MEGKLWGSQELFGGIVLSNRLQGRHGGQPSMCIQSFHPETGGEIPVHIARKITGSGSRWY